MKPFLTNYIITSRVRWRQSVKNWLAQEDLGLELELFLKNEFESSSGASGWPLD